METGGVVICIDNKMYEGIYLPLTIGRKYRILGKRFNSENSISICVNNDFGKSDYYKIFRFSTLEDIREKKIDNLLK
jgi:hypothetical protein